MHSMKINGRWCDPKRFQQNISTPAQRGLNMGYLRISKRTWTRNGGLANPQLFRRMRGGAWTYWSM
jgi:hypothetical protein